MGICDLRLGEDVRIEARILDVRLREGASSRLVIVLGDTTGTIDAVLWGADAMQLQAALDLCFVEVCGQVGEYNGRRQLTLRQLRTPLSSIDLHRFLPSSPIELSELTERLFRHIASVENGYLRALLEYIFREYRAVAEPFMTFPAAIRMHHAFIHGLLHHTIEVADTVAAAAECQARWGWRTVNRDLLITGALLHDIGKVQELDQSGCASRYSVAGELMGHIVLGSRILDRSMARVGKGFSGQKPVEDLLVHLIVSHHGSGEWGSPKPPLLMEAQLLDYADMISAELYKYNRPDVLSASGAFARADGPGDQCRYTGDVHQLLDRVTVKPASLHPGIQRSVAEARASYTAGGPAGPLPVLRIIAGGRIAGAGFRVLPIVGRAAAGTRLLDPENNEGFVTVRAEELSAGEHFLIRVVGDSMIGDGIGHGDLLAVERRESAAAHEIVVGHSPALGPIVKRLRRLDSGIELLSSNPEYPAAPVPDPALLRIMGVAIAVARP